MAPSLRDDAIRACGPGATWRARRGYVAMGPPTHREGVAPSMQAHAFSAHRRLQPDRLSAQSDVKLFFRRGSGCGGCLQASSSGATWKRSLHGCRIRLCSIRLARRPQPGSVPERIPNYVGFASHLAGPCFVRTRKKLRDLSANIVPRLPGAIASRLRVDPQTRRRAAVDRFRLHASRIGPSAA